MLLLCHHFTISICTNIFCHKPLCSYILSFFTPRPQLFLSCGSRIELLCCPFPSDKESSYKVIDWFSCRRMDLPLVSLPKSTTVWVDCHCSRDKISPGDHPPCKHSSPRPRMVINGVRLSHNKSNWVGYLCRHEIYTSSYLMWLFYWVLSAVRMPFIYLFICLLIVEEGGGCHSPASVWPLSCQRWTWRRGLPSFALPFTYTWAWWMSHGQISHFQ